MLLTKHWSEGINHSKVSNYIQIHKLENMETIRVVDIT